MHTVGVVGFSRRFRELSKLMRDHNMVIKSVYDENSQFNGVTTSDYPLTNDADEFWAQDYDLIMVCSMNSLHGQHLERAFQKGCHIFCEKPIVTTIDDYKLVQSYAQQHKGLFATGFVLRYSPIFRKIKELLPRIGSVKTVIATDVLNHNHGAHVFLGWRRFEEFSGGHTVEKGCHILDLLNWFIGSKPVSVSAIGGNDFWCEENLDQEEGLLEHNPHMYEGYGDWDDLNPFTSEKTNADNIVTAIKYDSGVNLSLTLLTYAPNSKRTITFYGVGGCIDFKWEMGRATIEICRQGLGTKKILGKPCVVETHTFGELGHHGGGDKIIIQDLEKALETGEPMEPGIEEALWSNNACIAMTESLKSGQKVDVVY